jgi:hypothetical protein
MSGSVKTAARGLSQYKLSVIAEHEVKQDKGSTESADNYNFTMVNGIDIIYYRHNFCTT